jgi:regulator of telomere elongation helicase 1
MDLTALTGAPRGGGAPRPAAKARPARTSFTSRDVLVNFPFVPYGCQQVFVERLIEALQNGQNALLESPTGTGKVSPGGGSTRAPNTAPPSILTPPPSVTQTLCLLCGALAWQQAYAAALATVPRHQLERAGTAEGLTVTGAGRLFTPAASALPPGGRQDAGTVLRLGDRVYTYADGGGAGGGGPRLAIGAESEPGGPPPQRPPVILYASRTHSQLSQVVRELKQSGYSPRVAVLASRDQLCVHPSVSKMPSAAKVHACRSATKARKCGFKVRLDETCAKGPAAIAALAYPGGAGSGAGAGAGGGPPGGSPDRLPVLDIEELVALGKAANVCPYFLPRDPGSQASAELIILPYAYLVDAAVRKQALPNVDLRGSVLIVDEAHNLEDVASEAASFELTAASLADCITDLRLCLQPIVGDGAGGLPSIDASDLPFDLNHGLTLLKLLLDLEERIDSLPIGPFPPGHANALPKEVGGLEGAVHSGAFIYEFMEAHNINFGTKDVMLSLLDAISMYMSTSEAVGGGRGGRSNGLEAIRTILDRVFRDEEHAADLVERYKVVVYLPARGGVGGGGSRPLLAPRRGRTLAYWCFSPSVTVGELMGLGVRSIILASGTLSPMDSYASELRVPFPVRLENPHVVGSMGVFAAVLKKGVTGGRLNSSYELRETPEYRRELGVTLGNLLRLIPDGALVFFASYGVMDGAIEFWKADRGGVVWNTISGSKVPCVEPRGAAEFTEVIATFNAAVDGKRGAVLFAVCRGKVSEGIDFADARGRAVIVTGLPYPPFADPKVALKKRFLDESRAKGGGAVKAAPGTVAPTLTGRVWYNQQATRAVNQAMGRVIRHATDYGAMLLLDERFEGEVGQISAWIRPHLKVCNSVGPVVKGLVDFFRAAGVREGSAARLAALGGEVLTPVYSAAGGAVDLKAGRYGKPYSSSSASPSSLTHSQTMLYDPESAEVKLNALIEAKRKEAPASFLPAAAPTSLLDALRGGSRTTIAAPAMPRAGYHAPAAAQPWAKPPALPASAGAGAGVGASAAAVPASAAKPVHFMQRFGLGGVGPVARPRASPPAAALPLGPQMEILPAIAAPPTGVAGMGSGAYMATLRTAVGPALQGRLDEAVRAVQAEGVAAGAAAPGGPTGKARISESSVFRLVRTMAELLEAAGMAHGRRRELLLGFLDFVPVVHRPGVRALVEGMDGGGPAKRPKL